MAKHLAVKPSDIIENSFYIDADFPFSFKGREYLKPIYDSNDKIMVLYFGRQSEKTVQEDTRITNTYGERIPIKDVEVGDSIATMAKDGSHMTTSSITWKSDRYQKRCVRIKTQLGYTLDAGYTHPIRQWDRWTIADKLQKGDRIAINRAIKLVDSIPQDSDIVSMVGYLLADGSLSTYVGFTQKRGPVLDHFLDICSKKGWSAKTYEKSNSKDCYGVRVAKGELQEILAGYGLMGLNSFTKHLPDEFMRLPSDQNILLIEALWACDGYIKNTSSSDYEISYCSVSKTLVEQIQSILWKFGIPSRIREYIPTLYKGTDKVSYMLNVRTIDGIRRFSNLFDVKGKPMQPLDHTSNDNRDTYPIEIGDTFKKLEETRTGPRRGQGRALSSVGLRVKPKYALSRSKLEEYVNHFKTSGGYDQDLVEELEAHLDTDIYWDKVVSVEDVGEQWCYDISVEDTNNFIAEGIITHNSTTVANKIILNSLAKRRFRTLYVTPEDKQTKEFSMDKLDPKLKYSPLIQATMWGNQPDVDNVYSKQMKNGSRVVLRSVYKNADGSRGISADFLCVDEVQHVNPDFLPVLEECISHSQYKGRLYAGTPDVAKDALDEVWGFSDKTEFMFRCDRGHWNRQDHAMIEYLELDGLHCKTCGIILNRSQGEWVVTNPNGKYKGYRTSQLMVPWLTAEEILDKRERYAPKRFMNEVLALPYESIGAPITEEKLRRCCNDEFTMFEEGRLPNLSGVPVFAGIDWGSGSKSYTVLSFVAFLGGRWTLIRAKRFSGLEADPNVQMDLILKELHTYNPAVVGADWGFGYLQNAQLRLKYKGGIVTPIFSSGGASPVTLNEEGRYTINRSHIMSRVFNMILEERIMFPKWEQFESFGADILAIRAEDPDITSSLKTQIKYVRVAPDDFFHSLMYAVLVGEVQTGNMMIEAV